MRNRGSTSVLLVCESWAFQALRFESTEGEATMIAFGDAIEEHAIVVRATAPRAQRS